MDGWVIALIILLVVMSVAAVFFAVVVHYIKKKSEEEQQHNRNRSPVLVPLPSKSSIIQMVDSEPDIRKESLNEETTKAVPIPEPVFVAIDSTRISSPKFSPAEDRAQNSFDATGRSSNSGSSVLSFLETIAPSHSECATEKSAVSHDSDKDSVSNGSSVITRDSYDSDKMSSASKKSAESNPEEQNDSVTSESEEREKRAPPQVSKGHQDVHEKGREVAPSRTQPESSEQQITEGTANGDDVKKPAETTPAEEAENEESSDESSDDCEFCVAERKQRAAAAE